MNKGGEERGYFSSLVQASTLLVPGGYATIAAARRTEAGKHRASESAAVV